MSLYQKYKITKQDLLKRSYGVSFESLDEEFLFFIEKERVAGQLILSDKNIARIEHKIKRNNSISILVLLILGVICLALGLYQFLYAQPLVGVNLYTHFPVISNGAIEIAGSLGLLLGCLYSYKKRNAVVERLVKSELIEDLKILKRERDRLSKRPSKKQKRFRQPYKVGKKKS
ncbi:hypothetical protein HNV08_14080 [Winogradskyella eckloniae]|uniref:hypothetical protein n=1 Tax=Winogradskyella eckloniae TaxID=1089306 RepID=UPI0015643E62|nr:hypothetical protein [Winogradskyella eckloniae]NRD21183.1 hypothetical protein [Winogradskyella eckloniae]